MRERYWHEKNWPERIFSVFAGILYGIWFVISRTIGAIFSILRKLIVDVAKSVYGKTVAVIAAIIFAWLIAMFLGAVPHAGL